MESDISALWKEQLEADLQIADSFLKAEYIKTSVKSYSHCFNDIFPSQNCDIQIQCNQVYLGVGYLSSEEKSSRQKLGLVYFSQQCIMA